MSFIKSFVLTASVLVLGFFGGANAAEPTPAPSSAKLPFSEDQRAAMEDFVRNFILDNPEVLMESVNRHRQEEEQKKEEGSLKILKDNIGYLDDGTHPEIGNPKGDITVVEFFDYNCGYCKRALATIQKVVENDKNVRVVFLDYPILSPQSTVAAKWAVAANRQGKYWEFHQAILNSTAPKDEENLAKIAKSVGIDVAKAKKDAAGKEVADYLDGVAEFGHKLNVDGTPAFIVGNQILRGFVEYEGFKTIVETERKAKK